jgi:hypothetical protein
MDAINKLSPEQRQAVMVQAQQEANGQIMREMMNKMAQACFQKCAGTSVRCGDRVRVYTRIWFAVEVSFVGHTEYIRSTLEGDCTSHAQSNHSFPPPFLVVGRPIG